MDSTTIREVICDIYGDEFPDLLQLEPSQWRDKFGSWPGDEASTVRLDQTYKISKYVNDHHVNVVEAILTNIGLIRSCRECHCTDTNCSQCISKTGNPCHWVEENLCSACVKTNEK